MLQVKDRLRELHVLQVIDLQNLINKSIEHFNGKIDFVLHSIGMS